MLRLSKKVEYGLMALQHLARTSGAVSTVREVADEFSISYDLLAKIMQELKRDGVVDSYQGVKGGYALMLSLDQITIGRVIGALESAPSLTECIANGSEETSCARFSTCTLKDPMQKLQARLDSTLSSVTVAQLL